MLCELTLYTQLVFHTIRCDVKCCLIDAVLCERMVDVISKHFIRFINLPIFSFNFRYK